MIDYFVTKRRRRLIARLVNQNTSSAEFRLKRLVFRILAVLCLHVVLMMWIEGFSIREAVWLTFTTVTTVGYGDISASSAWGQTATVLLLYVMGIWMVAQLAGEYLEYRLDRKDKIVKGLWSWKSMKDHIVIVNAPEREPEVYLTRLVQQFRDTPSLADLPIVVVSTSFADGMPKSLVDLGVINKQASTSMGEFFEDVAIDKARYVVFLAQNSTDPVSDSITLDLLHQFQRSSDNVNVVAEAVLDKNGERFRALGCDSIIRPVRAYPELLARAISAPGTEQILEDLFGYDGASIHRFDVSVNDRKWKDIVCAMIHAGLGTALAYIDDKGIAHACPPEEQMINSKALLVMARETAVPSMTEVEQCINAI